MDVTGLDGDLGIKFVGDDATSPALLTNGRLDMHKVIQAYHNMDFFEIFYNE